MARNRRAYLIVLATLVVFVYLREHTVTYFALYAVLAAPILSLLLTLFSRIRVVRRGDHQVMHLKPYFSVSETLGEDYVVKGETTQYVLTLKNNSFLPYTYVKPCFEADRQRLDVEAEEGHLSVGPHRSREVTVSVTPKYRGVFEIGVGRILVYDFLGLFKFKQKRKQALVLTVVPRLRNIPYLPLSFMDRDIREARDHLGEESYSVVSDLRKYQPTDSIKKIHWKVSAKRNELISKNFRETERQAVLLCIDNAKINSPWDTLEQEDVMVEVLASVMVYCNQLGYAVSLSALGDEDRVFSGDIVQLYRRAAQLTFTAPGGFQETVTRVTDRYLEPVNLVLFIQNLTEGLFSLLRTLALAGHTIVVFYFSDQRAGGGIEKLRELGIHCMEYRKI